MCYLFDAPIFNIIFQHCKIKFILFVINILKYIYIICYYYETLQTLKAMQHIVSKVKKSYIYTVCYIFVAECNMFCHSLQLLNVRMILSKAKLLREL